MAANTDTPKQPEGSRASTGITPWISDSFFPDPAIYGKYADFGITISDDGTQLLYNGQAVRLFADEKSDTEAFYLNDSGSWNLSVSRNAAGKITGIERISEEKAKEYQDTFFAEEYSGSVPKVQDIETVHETVQETVQVDSDKYDPYQPFGVTYSAADAALYFKKQRVKFFIDQPAGGSADVLWTDDAGTVNLAVVRDTSGRITSIESISEEKAKEYQSAADNYAQIDEDALEKNWRRDK